MAEVHSLRVRCLSNFNSIAIELNVPRGDFTSIAIKITLSPWNTALKKPVQSSLIFVRLGQGNTFAGRTTQILWICFVRSRAEQCSQAMAKACSIIGL